MPGALSAPMGGHGLWRPIFWGFWESSRITVAKAGMNQRPSGQLHRERLASAAAAPPVATTAEAGTVLGISHAQARQLATAAAAGCLIVREVVAPPRPPPSANELKLREELAWLNRTTQRLKAPRRSGRARPPDAIVETKTDDDDANDEATAQERNRRLAEEIGAPVCLWGAADVRRERDEAMDPEAKRPRTEAPWARWDQSSENDSAAPRPAPPVLAAPAASAAPGRRGPQPPGPVPPTHGWRGRIRAAEAEFNAWAAQHAPLGHASRRRRRRRRSCLRSRR